MINCFTTYYHPVYVYVKNSFALAISNNFSVAKASTFFVAIAHAVEKAFEVEFFGLPNMLLVLVISTILIDAYYGVKKSKKIASRALAQAQKIKDSTPEYRMWMRTYERRRFKPSKLQYTFFKCVTLLAYLFFVKTLLNYDQDNTLGELWGYTGAVVLKVPLAIFWYYDFKSIGNNSAYVYGKKAPIFKIVEDILELRIKNFINKNKQK